MTEKSQNGWTASKDPAAIDIKAFPIKGTDIKIRCQAIAGPILAAFAAEFHAQVEPIDAGALDDWAYCYRPVRGQDAVLSNHSSGTALDLNASKHPLGKEHTFTGVQEVKIKELVKKYGLRWGGSYKARKDEMHYEIIETPEQVKARTNKLGLSK
jgi:hypothetical protein